MSQVLKVAQTTAEIDDGVISSSDRICSPNAIIIGVQAADRAALFFFGLFVFEIGRDVTDFLSPANLMCAVLVPALFHCVAQHLRCYEFAIIRRGLPSAYRTGFASLIVTTPFLASYYRNHGSLNWNETIGAIGLVLALPFLRLVTAYFIERLVRVQLLSRNVFIITDDPAAVPELRSTVEHVAGNQIVGLRVLTGNAQAGSAGLMELSEILRANTIDAVILKLSSRYSDHVTAVLPFLIGLPVAVYLSLPFGYNNDLLGSALFKKDTTLGDAVLLRLTDRPLTGWRWLLKDTQDRTIAFLLLILTAPVTLTTIIAIKLCDPGPVFFCQERRGYGGSTFKIIKFRSMTVTQAALPIDATVLKLTTRNDPRVSPLGRLLRRTSLDELPQLLNVLKGDMWIVGPRPHPLRAQASGLFYPDAVPIYRARYHMKPGITGWAQVRGWRGPTDTLEQLRSRVEHDLYYIQNWSPLFDATILLRTFRCVFGQHNAF